MDPHMVALGEKNREAGSERHKSTTRLCGVNGEDGRSVRKGAAAEAYDRAEYVTAMKGWVPWERMGWHVPSLSRRDVCIRQDRLQGIPCQLKRTKNP